MQKIYFYFFCLYNSLYKDGFYLQSYLKIFGKGKIKPEDRTVLGLWFSTWLWTVVIRLTIILLFNPRFQILFIGPYELLIPLIGYAVYYFYFIDSKRYIDIYAKYRSTDKSIQRQTVKKIFIWMALPIVLIPFLVCVLVFHFQIDLTNR
jgi:hypothetical protein